MGDVLARLEKVLRTHDCAECSKKLYGESKHRLPIHKVSMRVMLRGNHYCIVCGYNKIKKTILNLQDVSRELEEKYGKELVVDRLTR